MKQDLKPKIQEHVRYKLSITSVSEITALSLSRKLPFLIENSINGTDKANSRYNFLFSKP